MREKTKKPPRRNFAMMKKVRALKQKGLSMADISIKLYGTDGHTKTIWRWLHYPDVPKA